MPTATRPRWNANACKRALRTHPVDVLPELLRLLIIQCESVSQSEGRVRGEETEEAKAAWETHCSEQVKATWETLLLARNAAVGITEWLKPADPSGCVVFETTVNETLRKVERFLPVEELSPEQSFLSGSGVFGIHAATQKRPRWVDQSGTLCDLVTHLEDCSHLRLSDNEIARRVEGARGIHEQFIQLEAELGTPKHWWKDFEDQYSEPHHIHSEWNHFQHLFWTMLEPLEEQFESNRVWIGLVLGKRLCGWESLVEHCPDDLVMLRAFVDAVVRHWSATANASIPRLAPEGFGSRERTTADRLAVAQFGAGAPNQPDNTGEVMQVGTEQTSETDRAKRHFRALCEEAGTRIKEDGIDGARPLAYPIDLAWRSLVPDDASIPPIEFVHCTSDPDCQRVEGVHATQTQAIPPWIMSAYPQYIEVHMLRVQSPLDPPREFLLGGVVEANDPTKPKMRLVQLDEAEATAGALKVLRRWIRYIDNPGILSMQEQQECGAQPIGKADAGKGATPTGAEVATKTDKERLAAIPPLDMHDGKWMTAVAAAHCEKDDKTNSNYLKTARRDMDRGAILSNDDTHGIDGNGRMWRRDPEDSQVIWYYISTLKVQPSNGEE